MDERGPIRTLVASIRSVTVWSSEIEHLLPYVSSVKKTMYECAVGSLDVLLLLVSLYGGAGTAAATNGPVMHTPAVQLDRYQHVRRVQQIPYGLLSWSDG